MKIAVTGKGGVGKTTLASLIIQHFAGEGKRVIAIDADPDANLASALGFRDSEKIIPISKMDSLIEERTGAKPGESGSFFKLNPKVDDLPETLWVAHNNIRLMVMGTVKGGGGGCVCPESAMLKTLMSHVIFYRDDIVVMDMEAGIEHLGRGTARAVDMFIIVIEPGRRSIETAQKIRKLAEEIGIKKIGIVANKIRSEENKSALLQNLQDFDVIGFIPYDEKLIEADLTGKAVSLANNDIIENITAGIQNEN